MRLIVVILVSLAAAGQPRGMETVIPALDYGSACSSSIEAVNLTGRAVEAEFEAHKESGALVLLDGQSGTSVRIPGHGKAVFHLRVENEEGAGWVRIREPAGPALAISATVECVDGDRLLTAGRDVAFAMRRPWFAGEVSDLRGAEVTVINVSERPARLSACYSNGNLYSFGGPELRPICSSSVEMPIPPFGTRRVPVQHAGNSWFGIRTWGEALVLEMLRPPAPGVKLYKVESSIQFGQEVAPAK